MVSNTEELRMLADTVRRAAREKIAPLAASIDEKGEFNREVAALLLGPGADDADLPAPSTGAWSGTREPRCAWRWRRSRAIAPLPRCMLIIQAVGSFPILHGGRPGAAGEVAAPHGREPGTGRLSRDGALRGLGRRRDPHHGGQRWGRVRPRRDEGLRHQRGGGLRLRRPGADLRRRADATGCPFSWWSGTRPGPQGAEGSRRSSASGAPTPRR